MSTLFIKSKIQFFESKSQQLREDTFTNWGCLSSQRYNFLKANHNEIMVFSQKITAVYQVKDTIFWKQITTYFAALKYSLLLFIKSKIQFFESKSQLTLPGIKKVECCLSSQRYNFLKANHNTISIIVSDNVAVYQVKDTIFWKQITTYSIAHIQQT